MRLLLFLGLWIILPIQTLAAQSTDTSSLPTGASADFFNDSLGKQPRPHPKLLTATDGNADSAGLREKCREITAYHQDDSNKPVLKLNECASGFGSRFFDYETADKKYYQGDSIFDGVVYKKGQRYTYYKQDEISVDLTKEFNCRNNGNKLQCLVCNCFHEIREDAASFEEQVAVSRVVHSRVLSPEYASSVCEVVHKPEQFSWTEESVKKSLNDSRRPVAQVKKTHLKLGLNSEDMKNYFPYGANALKRCAKSAASSLKYEKEFFATAYATKKTFKNSDFHLKCAAISKKNNAPQIDSTNFLHDFAAICTKNERRCLLYPDCRVDPAQSPSPLPRPKEVSKAIDG